MVCLLFLIVSYPFTSMWAVLDVLKVCVGSDLCIFISFEVAQCSI